MIPTALSSRFQALQTALQASRTIVDLGCGNHPIPGATAAVDVNLEPMERSLGHGQTIETRRFEQRGIRFVQASVDRPLPFADKEFDFAYSHHVFEHLEDPATACREIVRIARAGAIITPSPFAELAFGRPYHRWLVLDRADTLFFFSKRAEEDRPFGQHPEFDPEKGWVATAATNPFDMLLDDEDWYRRPEGVVFQRLQQKLRALWYGHSPVVETIFLWRDSFHCEVIRESAVSNCDPIQL
jgi:SAM-dependent methyltransferase